MARLCKERDSLKREFIEQNSKFAPAHIADQWFLQTRQNKAFELLVWRITRGTLASDGFEAIRLQAERNLAIAGKFDSCGTFFTEELLPGQEPSGASLPTSEPMEESFTPEESFS